MTSEHPDSAEPKEKTDEASKAGVAFVAGATGYTGLALVPALLRREYRVLAHIRPDSSRRDHWQDYFESLGATPIFTPWDEEALASMFEAEQPDLIFALVGTTRARAAAQSEAAAAQESYERIDYGLTAMLIGAAERCSSLSRFVYLSAMGAQSGSRGAYMRARWRAEEDLRGSGLPYTIARPALISGSDREESRALERMGALSLDLCLSMVAKVGLGGAKQAYRSITSRDLAEALALLAVTPAWENRVALRQDFPET